MRATPITNFKVDKLHYDYVETVRRNIVNYGLLNVSAAGETVAGGDCRRLPMIMIAEHNPIIAKLISNGCVELRGKTGVHVIIDKRFDSACLHVNRL